MRQCSKIAILVTTIKLPGLSVMLLYDSKPIHAFLPGREQFSSSGIEVFFNIFPVKPVFLYRFYKRK